MHDHSIKQGVLDEAHGTILAHSYCCDKDMDLEMNDVQVREKEALKRLELIIEARVLEANIFPSVDPPSLLSLRYSLLLLLPLWVSSYMMRR